MCVFFIIFRRFATMFRWLRCMSIWFCFHCGYTHVINFRLKGMKWKLMFAAIFWTLLLSGDQSQFTINHHLQCVGSGLMAHCFNWCNGVFFSLAHLSGCLSVNLVWATSDGITHKKTTTIPHSIQRVHIRTPFFISSIVSVLDICVWFRYNVKNQLNNNELFFGTQFHFQSKHT